MTIQSVSLALAVATDHEFGDVIAYLTKIQDLLTPTVSAILGLMFIHLGSIARRLWETLHSYEISQKDCHNPQTMDDYFAYWPMVCLKLIGYGLLMYATLMAAYEFRTWFAACIALLGIIFWLTPKIFTNKSNYSPSATPYLRFDRVTALLIETALALGGFYLFGGQHDLVTGLLFGGGMVCLMFDWIFLTRWEEEMWKKKINIPTAAREGSSAASGA